MLTAQEKEAHRIASGLLDSMQDAQMPLRPVLEALKRAIDGAHGNVRKSPSDYTHGEHDYWDALSGEADTYLPFSPCGCWLSRPASGALAGEYGESA